MQKQPTVDVAFDAMAADIVRRAFAFAVANPHIIDWASMSTPPRSELDAVADQLEAIPNNSGTLCMTAAQFDDYVSFLSHLSTALPSEYWQDERAFLEMLSDAYGDMQTRVPTIEETQAWVRDLHHGQTDKAGQPYAEHVLRVHARLLSLFPDASADVEHAALLHDAIEDCDVTADNLRRLGYSDETIRIVEAVTKRPDGEQTYAERIEHLARCGRLGALQVKIADLSDNSDPARLALLPDDKSASLRQRYRKALDRLQTALSEYSEHSGV